MGCTNKFRGAACASSLPWFAGGECAGQAVATQQDNPPALACVSTAGSWTSRMVDSLIPVDCLELGDLRSPGCGDNLTGAG